MAVPNLVPLLGSISGALAGPQLAQRAAAALGIAGTPAGNLVAGASPSAIGAGIATLSAGAEVDEAMRQALQVSQSQMGTLGQPQMQMGGAAPMPAAGAPMSAPPAAAPVTGAPAAPQQMPQGAAQQAMPQAQAQQAPQGAPQMPPQQSAPQPTMYNPFPQVQAPQSLGTGLGTLRPQQRPQMGSMTNGLV